MMTVAAAALGLNYFSFSEANAFHWPWESATTQTFHLLQRVYSSNIRTLQGDWLFSFSFYLLFSFCFLSHFLFIQRLGRVLFSFSTGISVSLTGAPLVYQMRTGKLFYIRRLTDQVASRQGIHQPIISIHTVFNLSYTSLFFHFGSRISFKNVNVNSRKLTKNLSQIMSGPAPSPTTKNMKEFSRMPWWHEAR